MKRSTLSLIVLLIAVFVIAGCGKKSSKDVATVWLNSFYHLDYDAAKKVSTDDTKKLLSQLQQLAGKVSDSMKKDMGKIVVTIKDVQEKGDTARVMYVLSDMPSRSQPLLLVKKNGSWLVEFTKNSGLDEAEESTPPMPMDDSMNNNSNNNANVNDSTATLDKEKH